MHKQPHRLLSEGWFPSNRWYCRAIQIRAVIHREAAEGKQRVNRGPGKGTKRIEDYNVWVKVNRFGEYKGVFRGYEEICWDSQADCFEVIWNRVRKYDSEVRAAWGVIKSVIETSEIGNN